MSPRSAGRLTRATITMVVGVAVVAASALVPLTAASAQVRPVTTSVSSTPPKSRPHQWSAAQALKSLRRPAKVNPATNRAAAIAHAASTEKTASYRISPAMLSYLDNGLGMRLGSSTLLTGVRSGATVRVSLPAPSGLRLDLSAGISQPRFDRSVLVIDRATGAATLSANSADGALRIGIPDAATAVNPSGQLSLRLPVLGQTVSLSGQVGYAADKVTVSLSGHLPGSVSLQRGVAGLATGAEVRLTTAGGLRVYGSAVLGHFGRQLDVPVSGVPADGASDWTFTVLPGQVSGAPLPGLTLSPKASGTISSAHGAVSFDVSAPTARPWTPVHGVSVSGTAVFSNDIRNGTPAPGIAARTLEAAVSGTVSVTSAQAGTVITHGAVAFNLASGNGILTSSGSTPVVLTAGPHRQVLDQAGFRGQLALVKGDITGSVRGTGRVSVTGKGRSVTTDTALSVSASGTLAARIPAAAVALSAAAPPVKAATSATTSGSTYTLSGQVYNFITGTLNIPLGSATLNGTLSGQTLTVSASAPTALPSSLPSWIPNPSYVSTQISVDESTDTLTLTAATGTSGGQTATLTVTIANASTSDLSSGTDVTGSLVLGGVPFAGASAASLDFTLGYTGGALSASLSGTTTSDASFGNGLVTIPAGATLTLATGSGLALNGTADINSGSSSAQITVDGTLTDLSDWSLQVSDANAPEWQPTAGLSVTPDFSGSITDKAGAIGFDLASAGSGPAATWTSPDGNAVVSVTGIEVSNQAPTANCSEQGITSGDLWIGLSGDFSYAPAGLANLSATGCFDLTARTAGITTQATGDLTSEFGSSLPFTVTAAGLTATVSSAGTYSLTGTATVQITAGVSGDPVFTDVGLSFSNTGVVAGVQIKDLSDLGFSGNGALYLSSAAISGFDPGTTFGFTNQTSSIDLKAGLDVSLSYTLPTNVTSAFAQIIPGFPAGASGQAMATLSTSGFSLDVGLTLPTPLLVASNSGSGVSFYLDQLDVGIEVGSENQVTLSGTGDLNLPAMAPGGQASSVSVKVGGYFNFSTVTLGVTLDVGAWNDAFGVTGLDVQDFGGSFGLSLDTGVPTPTLSIYADKLVLPTSWGNAIGVVPGTEISFDGNFSLAQPVLSIELDGVNGQPALTPLAIDPDASSTVINSFTVSTAEFDLAPFGGTNGAGQSVDQGASVIFDASIVGVSVQVNAAVDLTTPSVSAYVSVGSFSTGQIQVNNTVLDLDLSPSNLGLYLSGGISSGNYSFSATFNLQLGSSAAGAGVSLQVTAGLPGYLQGYYAGGYLNLSGSVSSDGTISAYGAGWLTAGGQTLGPVSFSLSLPGGLSWSDYYNSIDTIVQFFQNAGTSASEIVDILESLGYDTYDIVNSLGSLGDYSSGWLSDLASLFGFSSTYYDIVADNGLVLDVSGASQSPSTQVITYTVNGGANQSWAFVPSPYSGWYDVVNRNSGQCLTVQYNTATPGNSLIQYPCNDGINQLWYMGGISSFSTYVMWDPFYSNGTEEVADIQSAYIWPGGTMDQWTYNGGWNQEFTLINSLNY